MQRPRKQTLILLAFLLAATTRPSPAADFYVAPDGNDRDPGTEQKPFATVSRARDAVREKIAAGLAGDVTVLIRGGTYRIAEPVVFGPQDSGTEKFSVTYAAYPDEKPIISGGRGVIGWKADAGGTWTAEIPDVKAGRWNFRELFVDGRRARRARHPNEGYLRVEKVGEDRRTNFHFRQGELRNYADLSAVELIFLHDWSITRTPVKTIDEATRTLKWPRMCRRSATTTPKRIGFAWRTTRCSARCRQRPSSGSGARPDRKWSSGDTGPDRKGPES